MTNTSFKRHPRRPAWLALTFALVAGTAACGDLDETDSDPPSVDALASWDSSHLVAVRTYHKNPLIVDVQTGVVTGTLRSDKYYDDIAPIGNGEYLCLQNQAIDFFRSDGTLDESRSISAPQFTGMTISADGSTLAYTIPADPTRSTIAIAGLPNGDQSAPLPDVSVSLPSSLSISRDGTLVAFAQGDVGVATTHPPVTTSTCLLDLDPRHPGGPMATAFSPVEDKLAVSMVGGGLNIFDLGHFPDCTLVETFFFPDDDAPRVQHVAFAPDGAVLAISVEQSAQSQTTGAFVTTGVVRLLDPASGSVLRELPVYRWEMTAGGALSGPLVTDLQWSDTGDRIAVSTSDGPVQQWDVASGTLLWSASL